MEDMVNREYITHIAAFLGGIVVTAGYVFIDTNLGTLEYSKSDDAASLALVSKSLSDIDSIVEQAENILSAAEAEEKTEPDSKITESEEVDEESDNYNTLGVPQANSSSISSGTDTTSSSQEEVAAAITEAETLLAQFTEEKESLEEQVVFTTPSGLKLDANGNIINDDGSTAENTNSIETASVLPEGVFLTPSGQYVDAYGNIVAISETVTQSTTQTTEQDLPEGYFVTPSGAILDRYGNVVSTPASIAEENQEEYSTSSPPSVGNTIYIPTSLVTSINWNSEKTCEELGKNGQQLVLCELYKNSYDDYTWVKTNS